jgi:hypothetical protein
VKSKSAKFNALMKKNQHPHRLGMTGFAGKRPLWRAEEWAREAVGLPDPYASLDVRGRDYIYAHKLKKLKDSATKFNEPNFEVVEKALIKAAASKDSGSFEVRWGHDLLTEVLGNPEHRGHVRGVCSKMS